MDNADSHPPTQPPLARPTELPANLLQLLDIVEQLRAPQGCPWDRKQTAQSLIPYLLEETYEVIESIEASDQQGLQEELGDLLLHVLFQSQLAQEQGIFTLDDSIRAISNKLIRRHPHVFGNLVHNDTTAINQHWETAKQREKGRDSLLDGVPNTLPALTRSQRIQAKAASVGFDWRTISPVWDKIQEELAELQQACESQQAEAIEEEFGDLLFSLVNLGRFLNLDSEGTLRRSIAKFERRFHTIEAELKRRGQPIEKTSLEEMDEIWNQIRQQDKQVNTPLQNKRD